MQKHELKHCCGGKTFDPSKTCCRFVGDEKNHRYLIDAYRAAYIALYIQIVTLYT